MRRLPLLLAVVLFPLASQPAGAGGAEPPDSLRFERDGSLVREIDGSTLRARCGVERVSVADPYYGREMAYRACPLVNVLALGFGAPPRADGERNFFLRARDGYTKPANEATLAESGGYLAFSDAGRPGGGFERIDRRQVDPGPFYVVWNGEGQNDPHEYPWPYQLAAIEIAPFEREFPHTVPTGAPEEDPAWVGFRIFGRECVACHSINGEGGTVGPELNLPRSIVEYRPAEQLKAFIRDPGSFRYTSMPAHLHLTDAELAGLVAYFAAMKERKHEPATRGDSR